MRVPAEWERQECVQLTWPHRDTDWRDMLDLAIDCFVEIAKAISAHEELLIVTPEKEEVKKRLTEAGLNIKNITFFECKTNDTWARDHAFITAVGESGDVELNDFRFNGWGEKYNFSYDNLINRELYQSGLFSKARYRDMNAIVLEGGSIETDGKGTLLTTASCLLSKNRNGFYNMENAEYTLAPLLGVDKFLCLEHGSIVGDDTDGHIDTLARLCPDDTIVYVKCYDKSDEHFAELSEMEKELMKFKTADGHSFRLVPLPLPKAVVYEGERLPATYANFLIINDAVLVPVYGQADLDNDALDILGKVFPEREIIGIDCLPLIRQHGSLHCVTMQYPEGVGLNKIQDYESGDNTAG
jgi:agmatine deiminase